jgi:hypothetical protein
MKKMFINLAVNLPKGLLCLLIFLMIAFSAFSQNAGISPAGAVAPDASAGLDVNFTNKGLLIPRVSLTGTTSFAPLTAHVAGMVVYNIATVSDVTPGFYFNDGTKWVAGLPKGNAAGDMQYWDGTTWRNIPAGTVGQRLQLNPSGIPTWAP